MTYANQPAAKAEFLSLRTARQQLRAYFNIIYALIMHDIKNRFFGSGLGQIVMVLWPFVHVLVLLIIYTFTGRPYPFGTSLLQYSCISIFPFICFSYVARWIVFSALTNKSFLNYPIIKPLDILISRSILEIVSITIVGIMLAALLAVNGESFMPVNPAQFVYATLATALLAVGMGIFNAVITFIIPLWNVVITLMTILAYAASGILFVTSTMPSPIKYALSFNPVLQSVEWMRVAFYSDYPTDVLDKTYLLEFGLITLTLGLIMERLLRRFF